MERMNINKSELIQTLFREHCKAYPNNSRQLNQNLSHEFWNSIKKSADLLKLFDVKMKQLKEVRPKGIAAFFGSLENQKKKKSNPVSVYPSPLDLQEEFVTESSYHESALSFFVPEDDLLGSASSKVVAPSDDTCVESPSIDDVVLDMPPDNSHLKKLEAPKQKKIQAEIVQLTSDIHPLLSRKTNDTLNDEQKKLLQDYTKRKKESEKELKNLKYQQQWQRERRAGRKRGIKELVDGDPVKGKALKMRSERGHPKLIDDYPDLIKTICEVIQHDSMADERRRSESVRTIRTLDELHSQLTSLDYKISRSATYYHLMAKNTKTIDGKRHFSTAPVRLARATNDLHHEHEDALFARCSIRHLKELLSFLGPEDVAVVSQDDKARISLGVSAAKVQQPILTHMEYRVRLPDHDWVVAEKHKIIPSVYAWLTVKAGGFGDEKNLTYSGKILLKKGNIKIN